MSRLSYIVAILPLFGGCKERSVEENYASADTQGSLSYADVYNFLLRNNGFVNKSAKKLTSKLTFSFIQAGVQTDEYGQYIRLFFHADDDRDYLEIARCDIARKSNTCLFGKGLADGGGDTIEEINNILASETDHSHLTSAQLNNCWNELTNGCTQIGEATTDGGDIVAVHKITAGDSFIDLTAPHNQTVYYIARVCVNPDRLDERESINQQCSPSFRYTEDVKLIFDNNRNANRNTIIADLEKIGAQLDYKTKRGHELAVQIHDGLETCRRRNIKNAHDKNVRESVATLLGIGVGIGASIYTFGKTDFKNMGVGADAGKALGAAFADVVRSAKDYPRKSCPEATNAIAAIVKEMGFNSDGGGDITTKIAAGPAYLYLDLLRQYDEKLTEYLQVNNQYRDWFMNACFIANNQKQQAQQNQGGNCDG
ncbi:MAG: hypothetical protein OYH77_06355 [Pseudomonadota bacterium]|nr:hypothetical protein [Pseudomonadota bacterium]